jgi:hypothetical protein
MENRGRIEQPGAAVQQPLPTGGKSIFDEELEWPQDREANRCSLRYDAWGTKTHARAEQ